MRNKNDALSDATEHQHKRSVDDGPMQEMKQDYVSTDASLEDFDRAGNVCKSTDNTCSRPIECDAV